MTRPTKGEGETVRGALIITRSSPKPVKEKKPETIRMTIRTITRRKPVDERA